MVEGQAQVKTVPDYQVIEGKWTWPRKWGVAWQESKTEGRTADKSTNITSSTLQCIRNAALQM